MSISSDEKRVGCFVIAVAVVVVIGIILVKWGGFAGPQYGTGHRDGTVQKFSTSGYFVNVMEGELATKGGKITGGKDSLSGGNMWEFSVTDPKVAEQLAELSDDQHVRLHYVQYMFQGWNRTTYRVTKVEVLP